VALPDLTVKTKMSESVPMSNRNYYEELGTKRDASDQEIKAAYRKMAFEYHPDRNKNPEAAERMKAVNEAYAVLSDPAKRGQYDMLYRQYGDGARSQFRQSFSEQDIFRGSDIQQIFEEMARGFGLRGFEDIFKDFYRQGGQGFEFKSSGGQTRGFVFNSPLSDNQSGKNGRGLMGNLTQKILSKLTGLYFPQQGGDLRDEIVLQPEFAFQGGAYAYYHRAREKKLVVQVPKGVRDGQLIRLNGMGKEGTHGARSGDLLLKVKIRTPILKKIKDMLGLT
jgi:DnaJ-class molecular chaperone